MSRTPLPLIVGDISAFARSLGSQLAAQLADGGRPPGHVELLNMLARASGHRNFQHLRASALAAATPVAKPAPAPISASPANPVSPDRLRRLLRLYDAEKRLLRWPGKRSVEETCLWVVWSRIPARQTFSEKELNEILNALHTFGDYPLLRRGLCDLGLMTRTPDGREYRRVERQPSAEALELLRRLE